MTDPANLSPLRAAILQTARSFVDVVKEDDGENRDKAHSIQKFFVEGTGQSRYDGNLPWCAAFGSYCVVKGFQAVHQDLPLKKAGVVRTALHANSAELKKWFSEAGLYLPKAKVLDAAGHFVTDGTKPQPGDLMLVQEGPILHTGVVESFEVAPGNVVTLIAIEGNNTTDTGKDAEGNRAPDGVYKHHIGINRLKRIDGFCRVSAT